MGNYIKDQPDLPPAIAPSILPEYYQCIDVTTMSLQNAYYSAYGNHAEAEAYNGQIFVFKNLLVDEYMIRELDKGWIWADLIKCPLINPAYAKTFHPGDRVDIVGICLGRDTNISPGLYFKDCYMLPASCLQLPAPGGGGSFSASY